MCKKGKIMDTKKYKGVERREHNCPVENCAEVTELIEKNQTLSRRITGWGIASISVLSLVVTVLLYMSGVTLDIAKDTATEFKGFVDLHNKNMVLDEKVKTTLAANQQATAKQLEAVASIQLTVIQELSILKGTKVTQ